MTCIPCAGRWDVISQRYFGGQQALSPAPAEEFRRLLANVEKLVEEYNQDLADESKPTVRPLADKQKAAEAPHYIDTATLEKEVAQAARERRGSWWTWLGPRRWTPWGRIGGPAS